MNIAVTNLLKNYKVFERDFWLAYKSLEKILPEEEFEGIKMKMLRSKKIDSTILKKIDLQQFETVKAELDAEWKAKSEESKQAGTAVHEMIHNALITNFFGAKLQYELEGDLGSPESSLTNKNGLYPEKRLEVVLDDDYTLVGVADIIQIHDGIIDIIEWKTDEEGIKFKSRFDIGKHKAKTLKYPLNKYEDCNGVQYQLQLSIYMWMALQICPELKPGKLKIKWIKDQKVKKTYEVDYLEDAVKNLIPWHLKAIKLNKELNNCKIADYD